MQNLYEAKELQFRKQNDERKRDARNMRIGLLPAVREDSNPAPQGAAYLANRAPPLAFRPPSPVLLPPEPSPGQPGAPVQLFSLQNVKAVDASLYEYLLRPGEHLGGSESTDDVVLRVLESGSGLGLQDERAEGELTRHGCWYQYQPNEYRLGRQHAEATGKGWEHAEAIARRPERLQNIRALYISGNAASIDFESLAGCLVAKPPQLVDRNSTGALSALEVLEQGPGYGPHTLLLHKARVDGRTLETLAHVLQSNPLVDGMCVLTQLIFVNNCLKSVKQKELNKLLDAFKRNYRLSLICFSMNQIGNPMARCILTALRGCPALQTLILSDNVIGDG